MKFFYTFVGLILLLGFSMMTNAFLLPKGVSSLTEDCTKNCKERFYVCTGACAKLPSRKCMTFVQCERHHQVCLDFCNNPHNYRASMK